MQIHLSDIEEQPEPAGPPTELDMVAARVRICKDCVLSGMRKKAVPGSGPQSAAVMLIGEAPGHHENETGLPFVGAAGKFLDELLQAADLTREEVFITNIVKCRPPGNRDPQQEEVDACSKHLEQQIDLVDPTVIVTLGRYSMGRYTPSPVKIGAVHGNPYAVGGRIVVLMYHPAAALHRGSLRQVLLDDFARLPAIMAGKVDLPPMPGSVEATQMTML